MTPVPINLAVEDPLSEVVLRRLLAHSRQDFAVGAVYMRNGFGYLRKNIAGWNSAAKGRPFLLLTDLDASECPASLLQTWLSVPKNDNLLFRVAVREVESWLLADAEGIATFLAVKPATVPANPESLPDPKRILVELAARSRKKDLREDIAPRKGSTAKQGPDYNPCLSRFVFDHWNVDVAAAHADSLRRTIERLASFRPLWP
jgi:hypothetical protein